MATDKREVIDALDRAFNLELEDGPMDWKGMFKIVPSISDGRSQWAKLVRERKIKPWHVVWALQETGAEYPDWIAARVHLDDPSFSFSEKPDARTLYFNLNNGKDRTRFKHLETEYGRFLTQ